MTEREALLARIFAETYLGDGLYCRVDEAGQFVLRAPRGDGDHIVALDAETLAAFQVHVTKMSELITQLKRTP